jgi:hypothetical protein
MCPTPAGTRILGGEVEEGGELSAVPRQMTKAALVYETCHLSQALVHPAF